MNRYYLTLLSSFLSVFLITGCGSEESDVTQTQQLAGQYSGFLQTVDGENVPWDLDHQVSIERIGDGKLSVRSDIIGYFEFYGGCIINAVCVNIDQVNIIDFLNPELNTDIIEIKQVVFTRQEGGAWNLVIQYVAIDTENSDGQINQFVSIN